MIYNTTNPLIKEIRNIFLTNKISLPGNAKDKISDAI
jgi:hypothetical protein